MKHVLYPLWSFLLNLLTLPNTLILMNVPSCIWHLLLDSTSLRFWSTMNLLFWWPSWLLLLLCPHLNLDLHLLPFPLIILRHEILWEESVNILHISCLRLSTSCALQFVFKPLQSINTVYLSLAPISPSHLLMQYESGNIV